MPKKVVIIKSETVLIGLLALLIVYGLAVRGSSVEDIRDTIPAFKVEQMGVRM